MLGFVISQPWFTRTTESAVNNDLTLIVPRTILQSPSVSLSFNPSKENVMSTAPKPQMVVQDPVQVDPKHYKIELENDQVRVLRINYAAREKSVMHSHPDGVAIFQNDIHCRFTFPGGKTEEQRFRAGETLYMPAGSHLPENLSDQPFEVILVELKR
jgi:quercetin dioxygenase-like cupin family protein